MFFPWNKAMVKNTIVWEIFDLPPLDIVEQSFRVEVRHVLVNSQPMDYTCKGYFFANNGMM